MATDFQSPGTGTVARDCATGELFIIWCDTRGQPRVKHAGAVAEAEARRDVQARCEEVRRYLSGDSGRRPAG